MDFGVYFGDKRIGTARVERQGLYYHVSCRCELSGEGMYRLEVSGGEKLVDLGILVPEEKGFGLRTRFPVSRIGEGELRFALIPRHDKLEGRRFVPICPEEPFRYLERLKDAFLETQEGRKGACLPK